MTFNFFSKLGVQKAWDYRSEPESLRLLAAIFWRTIVFIAFLVFLLALWFGFQELDATSQAESVAPAAAAAQQPWTPAQLQTALQTLSQKQTDYQTLSQSALPSIADPSK